jgi:glutamyl-tRNA synthetase
LHIGGARTALFNWLLARKHGGVFVLRIEDTDRTRHVEDSLQKILEDFRWLGLQWDEGPQVGGPYGPYLQSERLDTYQQVCRKLLDEGLAYYAFDTPDELTKLRDRAKAEKRTFQYPRPQQFPAHEDADAARAAGRPVAVRFKAPDHDIRVQDCILGEVVVRQTELEDFVILKADGYPTYHFACVVDDAAMKITHVIRGAEHLNNTPKHIILQEALGYTTPVYAHLPLIFNMSGSKMSKRDKEKALAAGEAAPEIEVHDFRAAGYLPEAVLNFISLLGWSPADGREQLTLEETVERFDVQRIGKTNARFDREKLLAFNTDWAARLPAGRLVAGLRDYLSLNPHPLSAAGDDVLQRVLEACAGFRTFADVVRKAGFMFIADEAVAYDADAVKKVLAKSDGEGYAVLAELLPKLRAAPDWSEGALEALLQTVCAARGVQMGKVAQPLRVAVSGGSVSPAIGLTLVLLGRDQTLRRIERCLTTTRAS